MKRNAILLVFLAALSCLAGYLMSKASWIGRVGMTLFYKEYNLLKVWWQGAIAVYIVLLILFCVHLAVHYKLRNTGAKAVHFFVLLLAAGGAYLTYNDFNTELAHRMLGWRFHYGFYTFWLGWIVMCIFFLFRKKPPTYFPEDPNSKASTTA